ncbi:PAS domain S-box protein [Streptomyces sp. NPDC057496]|uniref:PAS domain S-box protein n=1 Tax=Streptomyces sp. NPDC057496 TaxID=3346149 RepID=UPI0036C221DC
MPLPPRTEQAIAAVYTARSLADTLQAIADAAVSGFDYELACVNLVRSDGDLVVTALAGNPIAEARITGRVGSRDSWERRLHLGEDWSGLRFIPHTEGRVLNDDVPQWRTESPLPEHDDGWHPDDRLFAPMYSPHGELIGVISVDCPKDGRRPGAQAREALRTYAFHSAIAISTARLQANMQRALVRLEREQMALRASEESFRQAFEYAPNGAAIADLGGDSHGRLLRVNDALCRLLERPPSALRRYSFSDLVHPQDIGVLLRTSAEGGRAELRLARRDGTYVWVSVSNSVVADTADGPRFLLTHVNDIGERKQRESELERRATLDGLTGLCTESELRIRLTRALCDTPDAAPGANDPHGLEPYPPHQHRGLPISPNPTLAVLHLGIDGFKMYNARHDRAAGDAALVEIAGRLRSELDRERSNEGNREPAALARIRGDEFVALVPDLDKAPAETLVARLRQALRPGPLEATGILYWATCGTTADQVLGRSGELLSSRKLLPRPAWVSTRS